jgi:hypothetical protein
MLLSWGQLVTVVDDPTKSTTVCGAEVEENERP